MHQAYFELLSDDSNNPCYFADVETHETLFLNKAMQDLLQSPTPYEGRPCYEVIHGGVVPCSFCPSQVAQPVACWKSVQNNGLTQKNYSTSSTLMNLDGIVVHMSKYFPEEEENTALLVDFDQAMSQCAKILSDHHTTSDLVGSLLQLLVDFYQAEKSYIYALDKGTPLTYYYCTKEGGASVKERISMPETHSGLMGLLEQQEDFSVIRISKENKKYNKDSLELDILEYYQVDNLTLSPIKGGKNELIGFVGMSDRALDPFDYRLLEAVTRFVKESFSVQIMEQELKRLGKVDLLTGFLNRTCYSERIRALKNCSHSSLGVVFVNLNGLRKTNEYFGYDVGDLQITKAVSHLRHHFPEEFYRISGDEFICFVINSEESVFNKRVGLLQDELKKSRNFTFAVGHSWGGCEADPLKLVSFADSKMYVNKQEYYFYTMSETQEINESILQDLLKAIKNREFIVYLQPKVQLSTGGIIGAEALVRRFDEKSKKMIYPDGFIPLYEKNAIIRHVDLFVLEEVCRMIASWGDENNRIPVAVNLSGITLTEYDIVETICSICKKYTVPHALIMVEITERVGLMEQEMATTLVEAFQAQGFKVSLDDFGTGYSNMVTLSQISVDEVKIDKSLVENLNCNPKNQVILQNVIHMCNSLENTSTLAEGIENESQVSSLRAIDCDFGQGYLYSKPVPQEEFFERFIKRKKE